MGLCAGVNTLSHEDGIQSCPRYQLALIGWLPPPPPQGLRAVHGQSETFQEAHPFQPF